MRFRIGSELSVPFRKVLGGSAAPKSAAAVSLVHARTSTSTNQVNGNCVAPPPAGALSAQSNVARGVLGRGLPGSF